MKRCPRCGRELPVDAFARDRHAYDGLQSACRECRGAMHRDWEARNRDRVNEQARRYHARQRARRSSSR
jgi:hypothetical protein